MKGVHALSESPGATRREGAGSNDEREIQAGGQAGGQAGAARRTGIAAEFRKV